MSILPPAQKPQRDDPSMRLVKCEAPDCNVTKPLRDMASYVVCLASTGDPEKPATACPAEQHYGCTLEHARIVAHACLDEHL